MSCSHPICGFSPKPEHKRISACQIQQANANPIHTWATRNRKSTKVGPTLAACKNCECSKQGGVLVVLFMRQRLLLLLFILPPQRTPKSTSFLPHAQAHYKAQHRQMPTVMWLRVSPELRSPRNSTRTQYPVPITTTTGTKGEKPALWAWEMGKISSFGSSLNIFGSK